MEIIPEHECVREIRAAVSTPKIYHFPYFPIHNDHPTLDVWPECSRGEVRRCITPRVAVPSQKNDGTWEIESLENVITNERIGDNYVVKTNAIYGFTANGGEVKLTNFMIQIVGKIIRFDARNVPPTILYKILITKSKGKSENITVKKNECKNICQIIQKQFPELFVSTRLSDSTAQYISDMMDEAENGVEKIKEIVEINYDGWVDETGDLIYHLYSKKMPDINQMNVEEIFTNGFRFLEVGHCSAEISTLFLYSHFAYLAYFFEKAGQPLQSVLFLRGMTGSLKTSVAKELANVFETDLKRKIMTFGSTEASTIEKLGQLIDQLGLMDDFSNSEKTKAALDKKLFERIIRIIGDGFAPTKMGLDGKIRQMPIRLAMIITGEDDPGLSLSSMLRCITLAVNRNSFDGKLLQNFQENPNVMLEYFTLFIQFLQENVLTIIEFIKKRVAIYRVEFSKIFDAARLVDAAVNLAIVGDVVGEFSMYCGVKNNFIGNKIAMFKKEIIAIISLNQTERQMLSVSAMYVIGIAQSINTKNGMALAISEDRYNENMSLYFGFEEKYSNLIWIDHKKAYVAVQQYWQALGQGFTALPKTVHQELFEEKIAVNPGKGNGFLQRSKKGSRSYMLVLDKNAVDKILKKERIF